MVNEDKIRERDPGKRVVEVFEDVTGEVVARLHCDSERIAERGEAGVLRNMNHERFSTRIVPPSITDNENR